MKKALIVLLLFATFYSNAQDSGRFNKLYDENNFWQVFVSSTEIESGKYLLSGVNIGHWTSSFFIWNVFINDTGDTISTKKIISGDSSTYYLGWQALIKTGQFYYLAGTQEYYDEEIVDGVLMKVNENGDKLWQINYGGVKTDAIDALVINNKSDLAFAGVSHSFGDSTWGNIYIVKTDTAGNLIWQKTIGANNYPERCWNMDTTASGGYVLAGIQGFDPQLSIFVIKIDSLGNQLWKKNFNGNTYPRVKTLHNGDILLTAATYTSDNHYLARMSRISPNGNILWHKTFPFDEPDSWFGFAAELDDGTLVNAGNVIEYDSASNGNWARGILTKTDAQGNLLWRRKFYTQTDHNNEFFAMIPTSDFGFLMYGYAYSDSNNRQDAWAVKVDSLGCLEPGCAGSVAAPEAEATAVALNIYPNPVADRFTVESPDEPMLGLRLHDLSGRVLDDVQFFRQYSVRQYSLSLAGQPPGVYVLSVRTDKGWVGRKVVKQ